MGNIKFFSTAVSLAGPELINQEWAIMQETTGKQAAPFPEQELRNRLSVYSQWIPCGLSSLSAGLQNQLSLVSKQQLQEDVPLRSLDNKQEVNLGA